MGPHTAGYFNTFAFVIWPYVAVTIFGLGLIYRFVWDRHHWNSQSSEILDKNSQIGSYAFHYGILGSLGGHVIGLLIPEKTWEWVGIPLNVHLALATVTGGILVGLVAIGLIMFLWRRVTKRRLFETTTVMTFAVLLLLLWIASFGAYMDYVKRFDYTSTIAPWIRSLCLFDPQPGFMIGVPFVYKVHVLSAFVAFALTPFSRLIHIFTVPMPYSIRPYLPFRRVRAPSLGLRNVRESS